jgi:CRISPR-associated endonuclease/helicase Cas3
MILHSHPGKPLQVHLNGVKTKAKRRNLYNFYIAFCSIYHDIAKSNEHFQNKLNKLFTGVIGYSNHSYLSTYISILILSTDNKVRKYYFDKYGIDDYDFVSLNIIANIITSHHGNLKNINTLFNQEELDRMIVFINSNEAIHFIDFINKHYTPDCGIVFEREYESLYLDEVQTDANVVNTWRDNSLKYYHDTQFNFSQLIEADKRDAGYNEQYLLDKLDEYNIALKLNLKRHLKRLSANASPTLLNQTRTAIRLEAKEILEYQLKNTDNRLFTITSPTGSGKTFMMLDLASTIQQLKGDYGIILSLPFTSIIDQTSNICSEDLHLDVLNYTSVSNSSPEMDELQKNIEINPSDEKTLKQLIYYSFSEETFDYPFVITTFVQFFQTLISNRNSTLIKLPNFTKRVFLIDEFQSIPVNLYTFFYGIVQEFCYKYDCYAIFSTATMPSIKLNSERTYAGITVDRVFQNFIEPTELLPDYKYYNSPIFNRYRIELIGNVNLGGTINNSQINSTMLVGNLMVELVKEEKSFMVVMNTVQDSLDVYSAISNSNRFNTPDDNIYLLNRLFAPSTRLRVINEVNQKLKRGEIVILVSTQLIEAGVDLDFPVVYRDIAPLPSIIQTAGRCNRNGYYSMGIIKVFKFIESEESTSRKMYRAEHVYHKGDIRYTDRSLLAGMTEIDLFAVQKNYFTTAQVHRVIGRVSDTENLVDHIYNGNIETLGRYRLIEAREDEATYYVGDESLWNEYADLIRNIPFDTDYSESKKYRIKITNTLKAMSKYFVNVNTKKQPLVFSDEIRGIRNLADKTLYTEEFGLNGAI